MITISSSFAICCLNAFVVRCFSREICTDYQAVATVVKSQPQPQKMCCHVMDTRNKNVVTIEMLSNMVLYFW